MRYSSDPSSMSMYLMARSTHTHGYGSSPGAFSISTPNSVNPCENAISFAMAIAFACAALNVDSAPLHVLRTGTSVDDPYSGANPEIASSIGISGHGSQSGTWQLPFAGALYWRRALRGVEIRANRDD